MRELMPKVGIENLDFPPEEIERIEISRNNEIKIHISDTTKAKKRQYEKWMNICGTLDQTVVERVSIGSNHYEEKKFMFTCQLSIGIAGKIADNITITLKEHHEIGF